MATGLSWIRESTMFAVAVVGSSTVLAIQYFRRKTIRARWLMAVAGFVFLLGHTVPWHFAFAVEQRLSPNPGAGRAITAIFDPSGSKFRLPEGLNHNSWFRAGGLTRDEGSTIYLPIRVAGLAESTVLNADRAEVLLTTSDGKMVYQGRADDLLVRKDSNLEPVSFNIGRSEEHTSELQSRLHLVCRLLLEKKKTIQPHSRHSIHRMRHLFLPLPIPLCVLATTHLIL